MRFTTVVLENFRGFRGVHEIVLHPELTVLAGLNGSGKSSVLDAAASCLSGMVSLLAGGQNTWFGNGDIANVSVGSDRSEWSLSYVLGDDQHEEGTRCTAPARSLPSTQDVAAVLPGLMRLRQEAGDPQHVLPFFSYIHSSSTRHAVTHLPGVSLPGRLIAYQHAFDSEAVQFEAFSSWFEQVENLENEEKIRWGNLGRQLPPLRAVRNAVRRFMGSLRDAEFGDLSVIRSFGDNPFQPPKGRLAVKKRSEQLFIEQLSDGERRLILAVADTARRMVVLNPKMSDALETPGILLIDEIELHLHPQWQRTVVAALRAAFPKLQFVLATHAPAVLASVPNECVVVLKDGGVLAGQSQVYGRDPNTILSTVMDTPLRPDDVQAELDALFSELDAHPRKAKNRIKRLEEKIGADDPDLVRARALLQLLAG